MNWEGYVLFIMVYSLIGYAVGILTMKVLNTYLDRYSKTLHIFFSIFWTISLIILGIYGLYCVAKETTDIFLAPEGSVLRRIQKVIVLTFLIIFMVMILIIYIRNIIGG